MKETCFAKVAIRDLNEAATVDRFYYMLILGHSTQPLPFNENIKQYQRK